MRFPVLLAFIVLSITCKDNDNPTHVQAASMSAQGLIAFYPFNGNANDEAGNGKDGTYVGALSTTDRFGKGASALLFDGIDDHVEVLDTLFNLGQQQYTICGWFCTFNRQKQLQSIFNTTPHNGIVVNFNHNEYPPNHVSFGVGSGNYWIEKGVSSRADFADSSWYFFAVVKDSISYRVFIDASLEWQVNVPQSTSYSQNAGCKIGAIGTEINGEGEFFNGKLDDYRIYDRALTAAEIWLLYHEGGW